MVSFDKRVLVWPMRRTDVGFDLQTEQETAQRRRKISPGAATNPTGITIKGHLTRATVGLQKDDHRFHRCLFVEVLSGLGKQGDRCASIHKITHFDHMLALALGTLWRRTHCSHL